MATPAGKRFWTKASLREDSDGFAILLDSKEVKTPNGQALRIHQKTLAEAICEEWQAQSETIAPESMPMFKFTVTALDRVAPQRHGVIDELMGYASHDLLCYRAEDDPLLGAYQEKIWQPYLNWAEDELGVSLKVFKGVMPKSQGEESFPVLRHCLEGYNNFELSGLHCLITVGGSLILGLAAMRGYQPIDAIVKACQLDELWQQDKWGYDDEATARLASSRQLLVSANEYLTLLKT